MPRSGMGLAAGHFGASGFENAAFPLGEALNAVSGNFVENRIHFLGDEFAGGEIDSILFLGGGPTGALGFVNENFGPPAEGREQIWHFPVRMKQPAGVGVAKKYSTEVSAMSNTEPGCGNHDEKSREQNGEKKKEPRRKIENAPNRNDVRWIKKTEGAEQPAHSRGSSDDRSRKVIGENQIA